MPIRKLLGHKVYALIIALLYAVIIAYLSLMSLNDIPDLEISNLDKFIHLLIYFLFALLWYNYFNTVYTNMPLIKALLLAFIYGIIIEVLQERLTNYRQFDFFDILANTIGAILVVPFLKLIKPYVKK